MLSEILVGLGTGLISSLLFLWFLTKVRPKISISSKIAYDIKEIGNDSKHCYVVKIINKTWLSKIYDIEAQLMLIRYDIADGGQNIFFEKIPLLKERVWSLNSKKKKDQHAEYAFQFICLENLEDIWNDNNSLEITVRAKHAFSGFSKTVKERYYKKGSSIVAGSFEFGNSMEIK